MSHHLTAAGNRCLTDMRKQGTVDSAHWNTFRRTFGYNCQGGFIGKPILGTTLGRKNTTISAIGYYVDSTQQATIDIGLFEHAVTASTVDDGGFPEGSSEFDSEGGHNCRYATTQELRDFLALCFAFPPNHPAFHKSKAALLNHVCDAWDQFMQIIPFLCDNKWDQGVVEGEWAEMATSLCRFVMWFGGWAVINPTIIHEVFGPHVNNIRGDTGKYQRTIVRYSKVITNHFGIWGSDQFKESNPDPMFPEACFHNLPPPLANILHILLSGKYITDTRSSIFYHDAITDVLLESMGITWIKDIEEKRSTMTTIAKQWYTELLINKKDVTDDTGFTNGIFKAFGITTAGQHCFVSPVSFGSTIDESSSAPRFFGADDNEDENINPNNNNNNNNNGAPNNKPVPKSVFDSDNF